MSKKPAARKKPVRKKSHYPREWSWPNGAKIAVTLNMALESFVRASQLTLERTTNKVDHFSLTYAEYAYKAGAWRLLDLMDEFKIKGSVSTNGLTGERLRLRNRRARLGPGRALARRRSSDRARRNAQGHAGAH